MSAQLPGIFGAQQPDVFTRVETKVRVNAVSGGTRVVCIIGEGETEETLVDSAFGGGADGRNADYSAANAPDGRHFQISKLDLVPNRSSILKNGVPLNLLEQGITAAAFDSRYGARLDPLTGRVELQPAHLLDFGTDSTGTPLFYQEYAANKGSGHPRMTSASLVDTDAPAETWTVRCVANIKDGYGSPVSGEAIFTVTGSFSGQVKNSAGLPIVWKSDGYVVSNAILSFAIDEGSVKFEVGDKFTIRVDSGVLGSGDHLVARYIANENLNDPETFATPRDAFAKHGQPSATNTLSLGIQMAFENGAPVVTAIQARPPVPRKTGETLIVQDNLLTGATEGATGGQAITDTVFPLQLGRVPDVDGKINVFVVSSDGSEEQLLLNKQAFYNSTDYPTTAALYSDFVMGPTGSAYTVIEAPQVEQHGLDGYIAALSTTTIYFQSDSASFSADREDAGEGDVGKQIKVLAPTALVGTYTITSVGDGYGDMTVAHATRTSGSIPGGIHSVSHVANWQAIDQNDLGVYLAITDDVAATYLTAGKGLRVDYVDTKDASFFDADWVEAYETAENVDVQIVVPLPLQTVSQIFQGLKVHCESQSNIVNQHERIGIVGALTGLMPDMLIGTKSAAVEDIGVLEGVQGDDAEEVLAGNIEDLANYSVQAAFGDTFRIIYLWPDQIVRSIGGTNTFLPGYFLAPALGGFLAGQTNIALPPTFNTLTGFSILRDRTARKFVKNQLDGVGVLVVEPVAGGGKMLHGLTTIANGAPEEQEISVVSIRDQVSRILRNTLRQFIGKLQSPTLVPEMNKVVGKLLRSLVGQQLLAGFGSITISRDPVESRQINIQVQIQPSVSVLYIFVDLAVEL